MTDQRRADRHIRIEITNHNPRLANLKGDTDPERSDTNPW